jgi:glycosyltransferase involved in cell wall biosynthesis
MSKILFIMKYPLADFYSVKGKFNGQMKAAQSLGHDVYYIAYDHQAVYCMHGKGKKPIKTIRFGGSRLYLHTKAFFDLYDSVLRLLRSENFDIAYLRHAPLSAKGVTMCRKLQESGCKIAVEISTYPLNREKASSLLRSLYQKYSALCWKRASKFVSLFALIGEEASDFNGVPAINISNGVDVDAVSLRQPQPEKKIHLLAVASMSIWHGYDRVIRGIAALDDADKEKIVLDMVGDEGDGSRAQWKQLVKELGLEKQVVFHGKITGAALDPFYEKADVGICSLGMHRLHFKSASVLKLREYTARGLPFVYAANDPVLPSAQDFCLKVPHDDTPVDIRRVIAFAQTMRESPSMPSLMRDYARRVMSWEEQMRKVIDRLND